MAQMQAAPPRAQAPSALPVARSGGSSEMRGVSRPSPPSSLPDAGGMRGDSGERVFRHASVLTRACVGPVMSSRGHGSTWVPLPCVRKSIWELMFTQLCAVFRAKGFGQVSREGRRGDQQGSACRPDTGDLRSSEPWQHQARRLATGRDACCGSLSEGRLCFQDNVLR